MRNTSHVEALLCLGTTRLISAPVILICVGGSGGSGGSGGQKIHDMKNLKHILAKFK